MRKKINVFLNIKRMFCESQLCFHCCKKLHKAIHSVCRPVTLVALVTLLYILPIADISNWNKMNAKISLAYGRSAHYSKRKREFAVSHCSTRFLRVLWSWFSPLGCVWNISDTDSFAHELKSLNSSWAQIAFTHTHHINISRLLFRPESKAAACPVSVWNHNVS